MYGRKITNRKHQTQNPVSGLLMLHALSVEFSTPDGRRMKLEAEPPPEFGEFPLK
jgi:hypothetical protein